MNEPRPTPLKLLPWLAKPSDMVKATLDACLADSGRDVPDLRKLARQRSICLWLLAVTGLLVVVVGSYVVHAHYCQPTTPKEVERLLKVPSLLGGHVPGDLTRCAGV